jgi:poly(beta-D-mannuronate) lyase
MKAVIVLAILCLSAVIYAETILVSSAAAIATAALTAEPGDIISMQGTQWTSANIYLTAYGNASHPIVLRGNGVKLVGLSKLHLGGAYVIAEGLNFYKGYSEGGVTVVEYRQKGGINCEYCTIRDSTFDSVNPTDPTLKYPWITIYGRYNTFTNNTLKNKQNVGPTIVIYQVANVPDHHVISYNNFLGRPNTAKATNDQETIRIGDSSSQTDTYTVVERNLFFEQNGDMEVVSSKSNRNIFRFNTFQRCVGTLSIRRADNNEVYGNQFIGDNIPGTGGVRVVWGDGHRIYNNYCENLGNPGTKEEDLACLAVGNGIPNATAGAGKYQMVTNLQFVYNTARGCQQSIVFGSNRGTVAPSNVLIARNILESNNRFVTLLKTPTLVEYDNYLWGNGALPANMTGYTKADPRFKDVSSFLLFSNTNAQLSQGLPYVTSDITGYARQSARSSPGCYQVRYHLL